MAGLQGRSLSLTGADDSPAVKAAKAMALRSGGGGAPRLGGIAEDGGGYEPVLSPVLLVQPPFESHGSSASAASSSADATGQPQQHVFVAASSAGASGAGAAASTLSASSSPNPARTRAFSVSVTRSPEKKAAVNRASHAAAGPRPIKGASPASIRVEVIMDDKMFEVIAPASDSVQDLARAIEAEYASLFPKERPLECCLILDEDLVPLQFDDKLSHTLVNDSVVHAISKSETQADEQFVNNTKLAKFRSRASSMEPFELASISSTPDKTSSSPAEPREPRPQEQLVSFLKAPYAKPTKPIGSAVDVQFNLLLRNSIALQHFKEHCIREFSVENLLFWLDVETFKLANVDPHIKLQLARRVYINYISLDAPLLLNLSQDIREKIEWPQLGVPASFFDEAQAHVYVMMKRHSFGTFLKSASYSVLEEIITKDPMAYAAAQGTSVVEVFPSSVLQQLNITDTIVDEHSNQKRNWQLKRSLSKYFHEPALSPQTNYFDDKNKLSASQKLLRIRLEKKLNKFFGDKPDAALVSKQLENVINAADDGSETASIDSEEMSSSPDKVSATTVRIKKAEKLTNFFGDQVPHPQLLGQSIVRSISEEDIEDLRRESSRSGTANKSLSSENLLPSRVSNELTQEERRNLTKRSRKLQEYFGENVTRHQSSSSPRNRDGGSGSGTLSRSKLFFESLFSSTASQSLESLRPKMMRKSASREIDRDERESLASSSDPDMIKTSKEYRRRKLVKLQQFLGERLSVQVVDTASPALSPMSATTPKPPSTPRSSVASPKLSVYDDLPGSAGEPQQPQQAQATKITAEEKKQRQKKIYKLGKMFGELPPIELIIQPNDSWIVRQRKSVQALTLLVDNFEVDDSNIMDLVELMREFDEYESSQGSVQPGLLSPGGGSGSALASPTASDDALDSAAAAEKKQLQRTLNQKKVLKITKFFGVTPDERVMTAQKVLLDLTKTIAEEARDDDELSDLQSNISALQQKIQRRVSNDNTATTDDARSSFYVVHGGEFVLPPRPPRKETSVDSNLSEYSTTAAL